MVRRENCLFFSFPYFHYYYYYLSCSVCSFVLPDLADGYTTTWRDRVSRRNGVCYWQITFPIESWVSRTFVFVSQHMSAEQAPHPLIPYYHLPRRVARLERKYFLRSFPPNNNLSLSPKQNLKSLPSPSVRRAYDSCRVVVPLVEFRVLFRWKLLSTFGMLLFYSRFRYLRVNILYFQNTNV